MKLHMTGFSWEKTCHAFSFVRDHFSSDLIDLQMGLELEMQGAHWTTTLHSLWNDIVVRKFIYLFIYDKNRSKLST